MSGPLPTHRPQFPSDFIAQAEAILRQRTIPYQLHQRAALACLLQREPLLSHGEAAARLQLQPITVRKWRRRWAQGDFSLQDRPGRGCKPDFSPSGSRPRSGHRLRNGL